MLAMRLVIALAALLLDLLAMMATSAQLVNHAMLLELAMEDHPPHVELPLLA